MKRTAQIALFSLLALTIAAPAALARGHHRHRRGKRFAKVLQKLNIDATTKSQIKNLFVQSRAEARAIRSQLRTQHKSFRALLKQDLPNQSAVMSALDTMSALKLKMKKVRLKTMLSVRQLLTPQQRLQLRQIIQQRRAKWRSKWRGKRGRFFKRHAQPAPAQ